MKRIIVFLVGILFIGVGIFLLISCNASAKKCTVETVGKVVDIKEEMSTDDDDYIYYLIISYQVETQTLTKQVKSGSSHIKYNLNDNVNILYNPDNIEEFIIKGDNSANIMGIIFIILGALLEIFEIINPKLIKFTT